MQRIKNMAAKSAVLKFLTCKAQSMWLYGVDTRRKLSKQNSPAETSQGQWFPSLLGWSPGNPATRRDPCQQLEKADLFLLSLKVSAYSLYFFFAVTHFLLEHTEEGSRLQAGEMLPDPCSTRESSCLLFPSQGDWRIISLLDDSPIPALLLCEFSCCYINVSSSQCSQLQWHKGSVNITSREEIPFEKGLFYSLVTHVIAFICCNEIFHKSSLHGLAPFSIAQLPGIFLLAK